VLAALVEQGGQQLGRLTPGQLVGMAAAAGRVAARAQFLQLAAIGAFARHWRARAAARKTPPGRGPGEFAAEELAMELVTSPRAALDTIDLAADLAGRLPRTSAALAAGLIDAGRARIIGRYTRFLADPDAATAEAILARVAPELTCEQLARKGLATAMKLDPGAIRRGKDEARAGRQRVEARPEYSGNAALAGRELAVEDALAAALRRRGVPGSLRELRVVVYLDLTQGRDPLARLTRPAGSGDHPEQRHRDTDGADEDGSPGAGGDGDAAGNGRRDGEDFGAGDDDQDPAGPGGQHGPASPSGSPAPFPALINLTIPAGTLFGFSRAPVRAQPRPQRPGPGPHRHLPGARLRRPRAPQRPGPHGCLPGHLRGVTSRCLGRQGALLRRSSSILAPVSSLDHRELRRSDRFSNPATNTLSDCSLDAEIHQSHWPGYDQSMTRSPRPSNRYCRVPGQPAVSTTGGSRTCR
jgi:hypothetical protein